MIDLARSRIGVPVSDLWTADTPAERTLELRGK